MIVIVRYVSNKARRSDRSIKLSIAFRNMSEMSERAPTHRKISLSSIIKSMMVINDSACDSTCDVRSTTSPSLSLSLSTVYTSYSCLEIIHRAWRICRREFSRMRDLRNTVYLRTTIRGTMAQVVQLAHLTARRILSSVIAADGFVNSSSGFKRARAHATNACIARSKHRARVDSIT